MGRVDDIDGKHADGAEAPRCQHRQRTDDLPISQQPAPYTHRRIQARYGERREDCAGSIALIQRDDLALFHVGGEALLQLKGQQRTDAVLLRLAIAGTQAGTPEAKADVREMGERIVAASLRPERLRVFRSCPLITSKDARSSLQMLAIARAMTVLCA